MDWICVYPNNRTIQNTPDAFGHPGGRFYRVHWVGAKWLHPWGLIKSRFPPASTAHPARAAPHRRCQAAPSFQQMPIVAQRLNKTGACMLRGITRAAGGQIEQDSGDIVVRPGSGYITTHQIGLVFHASASCFPKSYRSRWLRQSVNRQPARRLLGALSAWIDKNRSARASRLTLTRSSKGKNTSSSRVSFTSVPNDLADSASAMRRAMSSVKSFSCVPMRPIAPGSLRRHVGIDHQQARWLWFA